MSYPTVVTKLLAAASSTSIGSILTATAVGGGAVTLSCATLDTARRITVTSASLSGPSWTITGLNEAGSQISEVIVPSTTVVSAATTTQDFIKVTSVVGSCLGVGVSSGGYLIGTTTQGGTPWKIIDTTRNPTNVEFNLDITSPSTVVAASFEYTQDWPDYSLQTNTWRGFPATTGPRPTISSFGSTVTLDTSGLINFPITAWRVTVTSTSSGAGSMACSVLQSGY